MAGAGKKTFTAGETLTASDVNTYLMEQSVMVFGGTAARSSAIPTPSEGMFAVTTDDDELDYYNGSAWVTASRMGSWTTFTPNVINFGVGAGGTSTGAYVLVGKTLHLRVNATLGTGFNVSGALSFTLPASLTVKSSNIFTYSILDDLAAYYVGLAVIGSNQNTMQLWVANASSTYLGFTAISSSVPHLWAIGDTIGLWMTCEVN
jgi:hypothetical protein